jgi:hypothetical protein
LAVHFSFADRHAAAHSSAPLAFGAQTPLQQLSPKAHVSPADRQQTSDPRRPN